VEIKSKLYDNKIESWNILIELSIGDYIGIARNILNNNPFQRKVIKNSNKIYSLLKHDLLSGCIMPSIVLALKDSVIAKNDDLNIGKITEAINKDTSNLIILDGLQRTNILLDLEEELKKDTGKLKDFSESKIRVEVYLGISRIGILYRMLTLNTGQTRMTLRHQIEIMYNDYSESNKIENIILFKEIDEITKVNVGTYLFRDVVDGFNSYLTRNELPINRNNVLDSMEGIEELSKEENNKDLFGSFILTYNEFINKINMFIEIDNLPIDDVIAEMYSKKINDDYEKNTTLKAIKDSYFNVNRYFNKSISMTGFGAALGKLIDAGVINSFDELKEMINKLTIKNAYSILELHVVLKSIKDTAKNIGTYQRIYYYTFFKELFNKNSDSYLNIDNSIQSAYRIYASRME
jgi:hypothetical protein